MTKPGDRLEAEVREALRTPGHLQIAGSAGPLGGPGAGPVTPGSGFAPFQHWADVVEAAGRGERLWYKAPLDHQPRLVRIVRVFKNGKIRIDPMSRDADDFTADAGHLDRFRRRS